MTIKNASIEGVQTDPEFYHNYNPGASHRGSKDYVMSRSDLMEFNHCPHRWVGGYHKKKTDALGYGAMIDAFVLDYDRFEIKFVARPNKYLNDKDEEKKWNNNSNTCKAWNAVQAKSGKTVISTSDFDVCMDAQKALLDDEIINSFLESSDYQVMIVAEWHDEKTGLVIPLKCLIDIVPKKDSQFKHYLGDLKTCRTACLGQWAREVFNYGYHIQGAFYLDMYESATGEVRNCFAHVLQESYEPFEVGRRGLDEEFIELGAQKYTEAIEKYCECLKSKTFGGYDDYSLLSFDGFTSTGPEAWMITKQD